jgi:hypothetical protein
MSWGGSFALFAPTFRSGPSRPLRGNGSSPPLARSERHLKLGSVPLGEFNRSASNEADRFVCRPNRVKPPAAAPWRGLGALAFVESAKGSDPNDGETGETPP